MAKRFMQNTHFNEYEEKAILEMRKLVPLQNFFKEESNFLLNTSRKVFA